MRFHKKGIALLRAVAGVTCLPVIYMAACLSLPYLEPGLSRAALLSAEISFPLEGDTLSAEFAEEEDSISGLSSSVEAADPQPLASAGGTELSTASDYLQDLVPVENAAPEQTEAATLVKPANAGVVNRKTYGAGAGNIYIPLQEGYIKNCTKLDTAEIVKAVSQEPSIKITGGKDPEVLIMHTHATESYQPQPLDWYDKSYNSRTTDLDRNTCRVGDEILAQLTDAGISALHDTTLHDYPSYNGAYERSAETVKGYLSKYPSIKVVLDVHRDAIQPDGNTMVAPVTTIDGKSAAQVMIISGCDNGSFQMPNYMENLKFSAALQRQMEADYPTLARPILFDYRKYNQDLTTGSILLEVGGHANTLEEAIYCGELVGKSLAKTLLSLKE